MAARLYVAFTPAQLEAVKEALASRLADAFSELGLEQRFETYEAADAAVHAAVKADVAVFLSAAEGRGLAALAGEGFEGLLTDASAARGYIGNAAQQRAAERAHGKLEAALGQA